MFLCAFCGIRANEKFCLGACGEIQVVYGVQYIDAAWAMHAYLCEGTALWRHAYCVRDEMGDLKVVRLRSAVRTSPVARDSGWLQLVVR